MTDSGRGPGGQAPPETTDLNREAWSQAVASAIAPHPRWLRPVS
jgi:hypothetical protein